MNKFVCENDESEYLLGPVIVGTIPERMTPPVSWHCWRRALASRACAPAAAPADAAPPVPRASSDLDLHHRTAAIAA